MDAEWYLVQTKPRRERTALENLLRQHYDAFLPSLRARPRFSPATARIEPAFPRYLFVRLQPTLDNFAPIRSTVGVAHLVRFGAVYARVPDALIAELRSRIGSDGLLVVPQARLQPGDRVRVQSGALAGYEAIYTAMSGRARVELLIELAGRHVRFEVPAGTIERASD